MSNRITRSIKRTARRVARSVGAALLQFSGTRRWQAAKTDRLNETQWADATGDTINEAIDENLETLRYRAALEIARNPILEGIIETFCDDMVGENGPSLQVNTSDGTSTGNSGYESAVEDLWKEWFAHPTPTVNRPMGGPELLRVWFRGLWRAGEYLGQKITWGESKTPIALRVHPIHPRRLATPIGMSTDEDVVMGIRLNEWDDPVTYYVERPSRKLVSQISDPTAVPAADMLHVFRVTEEDQVRGIPWLAPCLQSMADMRDADDQVLDAIRQAADLAVLWYSEHPDAPYLQLNSSEATSIQRRQQTAGPPGWKPTQVNPAQPGIRYLEYRMERLREWGRPVGMPLMIVRQDSSGHNYSSARFDGQGYDRGLRVKQSWAARTTLNPLVEAVSREAVLAGAAPARPKALTYSWTWPTRPHVDPSKEADAEAKRLLQNRTLSLRRALASHGIDEDDFIKELQRTDQKLEKAGLPTMSDMIIAVLSSGKRLAFDEAADDEQGGDGGNSSNGDGEDDSNDNENGNGNSNGNRSALRLLKGRA